MSSPTIVGGRVQVEALMDPENAGSRMNGGQELKAKCVPNDVGTCSKVSSVRLRTRCDD